MFQSKSAVVNVSTNGDTNAILDWNSIGQKQNQ